MLQSCQDTILETGLVNGVVLDETTDEGIAGATVSLLTHESSGGFGGGGGSTQIDFTTSAADGSFSFQFDYDKSLAYTCAATHDQYFDYGDEFPVLEEIKQGINAEVKLQPKGYLELHVYSINTYSAGDHIDIQSGEIEPLYGNDVDTLLLISVEGNKMYHIVWFIYEGGLNDGSESEDIYCPAFDTTHYELLY